MKRSGAPSVATGPKVRRRPGPPSAVPAAEALARYAANETVAQIAARYGVTRARVWKILSALPGYAAAKARRAEGRAAADTADW